MDRRVKASAGSAPGAVRGRLLVRVLLSPALEVAVLQSTRPPEPWGRLWRYAGGVIPPCAAGGWSERPIEPGREREKGRARAREGEKRACSSAPLSPHLPHSLCPRLAPPPPPSPLPVPPPPISLPVPLPIPLSPTPLSLSSRPAARGPGTLPGCLLTPAGTARAGPACGCRACGVGREHPAGVMKDILVEFTKSFWLNLPSPWSGRARLWLPGVRRRARASRGRDERYFG